LSEKIKISLFIQKSELACESVLNVKEEKISMKDLELRKDYQKMRKNLEKDDS
jgi:hypothetical protein